MYLPAQLSPSCSAIKAIFNSVLSMTLSDAARHQTIIASDILQSNARAQEIVVWGVDGRHA